MRKQKRIALIVGNGSYTSVSSLPNPRNDANAISFRLNGLGFDIIKRLDLTNSETEATLNEFQDKLDQADVSLLFFAGHGLQVQGKNYLVPVDAEIKSADDLDTQTILFDNILNIMTKSSEASLIFLDACRNNPFSRSLRNGGENASIEATGMKRGLAEIKSIQGTFIAYATAPDDVASDGHGKNSPFTAALLEHIETPGLSISDMMINVRNRVLKETGGKQTPWDASALRAQFYFAEDTSKTSKNSIFAKLKSIDTKTKDICVIHHSIKPTPNFTGRTEELQALDKALWSGNHIAAVTQPAAVHGLGGVGKSVLAKEYAWQNRERYQGVWWLNAEYETGVTDGLVELGTRFIPGLREVKDKTEAANATLAYLASHAEQADKPWLLVYDNIENEEAFRNHAPTGGVKVLLTTRDSKFSKAINPVSVDRWPLEDAVAYLRKESGRRFSDEEAGNLAEALGCLPLALSHAAAFLKEEDLTTVSDYLSDINDYLKNAPDNAAYPKAVFATFQQAIKNCEARVEGASAILSLAVFFDAENILLDLYEQDKEYYPEALQTLVENNKARRAAFGALSRYSLIDLDIESKVFSLHRLVQAAIKDELLAQRENSKEVWADCAANVLEVVFPNPDQLENWPLCESLVPHIQHLSGEVEENNNSTLANLFNKAAGFLNGVANYAEAEPLFIRALEIKEKSLGPEHPFVAISLNNLAGLYKDTNRLAPAEPLLIRALAIMENSLGPEHRNVATSLNNLALLYDNTNRKSKAEPLYIRALEIREKSLGPEHPDVASSLNNLAGLYQDTNRMDQAEPLYLRALAIREKSYGPEHPRVASSLNNLAYLYQATYRMDQAEPLYIRALAIMENSLGPEHPDVATSLNGLALLYDRTNRLAEAEPLYMRALDIKEKNLGPDHPDVATSLNNLAGLYYATNRLDQAEPLLIRALEIKETSLGPEHPDVAQSLNNLAQLYSGTNRYQEAEPLYLRALDINETSYGPEHPSVALSLNNLAGLYYATNRLDQAEPLYMRALEIQEKSYGPEHPDVATSLNNLALLYDNTNRVAEAEPLYQRAFEILEKSYGPEHPRVATSLNNLAALYSETNRMDQAEPLYLRALKIKENSFGPEHPDVANSLNGLARLYKDTNRKDQAEPLFLRALEIREKSLGPEHPSTITVRNNLNALQNSITE